MVESDFPDPDHLLMKVISGSRAYGLHTAQSDTDIRGIYLLGRTQFFGFDAPLQINNETNDIVFYELKKFMELLVRNNPNILELLASPQDCVLYKHPLMERLQPGQFLSRLCQQSFAGYAQTQIKKARGLNKKILNPMAEERKSLLDFCYVIKGQGSAPLDSWLSEHGYKQKECGLSAIPNMRDCYGLYHYSQMQSQQLSGISSGEDAFDVSLSSIPKGINPLAFMSFNKDAYSRYCKDYKAYWEWTEKRNEHRFQNTLEHGKNYDAKNMMHTFRLLSMAEEIARYGEIRVRRSDRDFLLDIKSGQYECDALLEMANERIAAIEVFFQKSDLPEVPDIHLAEQLLVEIREQYYQS